MDGDIIKSWSRLVSLKGESNFCPSDFVHVGRSDTPSLGFQRSVAQTGAADERARTERENRTVYRAHK